MTLWVRDEHEPLFGRQRLTLWSGAFASDYEGQAWELPRHDGFAVIIGEQRVRVSCEAPRDEENYERVDDAIRAAAVNAGKRYNCYRGDESPRLVDVDARTALDWYLDNAPNPDGVSNQEIEAAIANGYCCHAGTAQAVAVIVRRADNAPRRTPLR